MTPEKPYFIRPRYKLLIYIFGSMILFVLITATLSYLYENTPFEELERSLFVTVFLLVVLVPIILFFARKQIILYSDAVCYSNGFKKQCIFYNTIVKSDIRLVVKNKYPDMFWNFEIKDNQFFSVPVSYYSRKDLQVFAKSVLGKAPLATHTSVVHEAAEGKFPWYIR